MEPIVLPIASTEELSLCLKVVLSLQTRCTDTSLGFARCRRIAGMVLSGLLKGSHALTSLASSVKYWFVVFEFLPSDSFSF